MFTGTAGDAGDGGIGGRAFDLVFFFGSSAAAALVGVGLLLHPAWTVPAWWLFTLLADGPHLFITATRTYLSPDDRRRLGLALWLAPLWLLAGPLALAITKVTGSRGPWDLFLLFAAVWSYHHVIRQHHGVLAIWEHHAGADRFEARASGIFLQGALWAMIVVYLVVSPASRLTLGLPTLPGSGERAFVVAVLIGLGAATLVWLLAVVRHRRRTPARARSWRPIVFALGPVGAFSAFNLFVVGAHEPVLARPPNAEQCFLAVTTVGGLVHSFQYLGIVLATNRRRYQGRGRSALARLGRAPILGYLAVTGASLVGYGLLNGARGVPGVAFFGLESDASRLFLGVYWGLFFMHYQLDQIIWHPSRDPALRVELGLARSS